MNYRIIGSVAVYHWFSDSRVPRDIDILTPIQFRGSNSNICVIDTQWHEVAQELIDANKDPVFLDPDLLFTLKVSHAEWDIKWEKTMHDIFFLKTKGCELNVDLAKKLHKVWERVHGKKKVNLTQSMETFFNDGVKREYDHEKLHELVAFYERPIHEMLRPDVGTAWCSEARFNELSYGLQLETAWEEMMAVAIERGRLTAKSKNSEISIAMHRAHKQLCTSMTTGWFARFLILNQIELLHKGKPKWKTQLTKALNTLQNS
ncbi:hypothetical protein [Acinetobacter sp.]|uniref:DUF7275 domain-containing protein n=1 Tax=Acinetobacter sp. TaxID=472 RepID=UPI003890A390